MDFAASWDETSSMLRTRTRREPLPGMARRSMVEDCSWERMTLVTVQERARRMGVRSWAILPWPPRRRTCLDMVEEVGVLDAVR
jgi:hypothetical protein